MKKCRLLSILIFLLFHTVGHSQKANFQSLHSLCAEEKFEEAYRLVNSKSFKYKKDETEEYLYLYSFACKELYLVNPEINSAYRNEGIRIAGRLISSTDSAKSAQGKNMIDFLTTTIYNDVITGIRSKNNLDSNLLGDFTTETIEVFAMFNAPKIISDSTLYFVGSSFYNDGVFIMTEMITYADDIEIITDRANRSVALFNVAAVFFKALCKNYNLHCDTHKMILDFLGKSE